MAGDSFLPNQRWINVGSLLELKCKSEGMLLKPLVIWCEGRPHSGRKRSLVATYTYTWVASWPYSRITNSPMATHTWAASSQKWPLLNSGHTSSAKGVAIIEWLFSFGYYYMLCIFCLLFNIKTPKLCLYQ